MFLSLWDEGEKAPGSFSSLTDIHMVDVFDNTQWSLKGIRDRAREGGGGQRKCLHSSSMVSDPSAPAAMMQLVFKWHAWGHSGGEKQSNKSSYKMQLAQIM